MALEYTDIYLDYTIGTVSPTLGRLPTRREYVANIAEKIRGYFAAALPSRTVSAITPVLGVLSTDAYDYFNFTIDNSISMSVSVYYFTQGSGGWDSTNSFVSQGYIVLGGAKLNGSTYNNNGSHFLFGVDTNDYEKQSAPFKMLKVTSGNDVYISFISGIGGYIYSGGHYGLVYWENDLVNTVTSQIIKTRYFKTFDYLATYETQDVSYTMPVVSCSGMQYYLKKYILPNLNIFNFFMPCNNTPALVNYGRYKNGADEYICLQLPSTSVCGTVRKIIVKYT